MPTLNVTPNPADTGSTVTITGTGFANLKTRLLLDGAGSTTNIFRPASDGTFKVGINVSTSARTQTLVAQQQSGSSWITQDTLTVVVRTPIPPDTTAPIATDITVTSVTQTSATITWKTVEASTGAIEYGINIGYGSNTTVIPTTNTFTLTLSPLTPDTTYHFRTLNVDAAGNVGKSVDNSFKTTPADIPPPEPGRTSKTIDASQSALLAALADKSIDDIIINDGVIKGGFQINKNHAGTAAKWRTVKAKNRYGVKIDGPYTEGINFRNAAAYLTLDGFEFTNANVAQGGCIVFGASGDSTSVAAHHINLLNMKAGPTITGPSSKGSTANATGHALYIGDAVGEGHHHIIADGWVVDAQHKGLSSGYHMYHSSAPSRNNGHDIQITNFQISGTPQAIILWDSTIYNILLGPNVRISDSSVSALRHEYGNATLDDFVSTGSANKPPTGGRHGTLTIKPNCVLN